MQGHSLYLRWFRFHYSFSDVFNFDQSVAIDDNDGYWSRYLNHMIKEVYQDNNTLRYNMSLSELEKMKTLVHIKEGKHKHGVIVFIITFLTHLKYWRQSDINDFRV